MGDGEFPVKMTGDASALVAASQQATQALVDTAKVAGKATNETHSEMAAGVKNVSQAEAEFATKAAADTVKVTVKKAELKHAIQGLKEEFPALARISQMALNPITLVVAGVGAAFGILKYRVDDAVKTLAGAVLPDISAAKVGQVTAMAEAWKTYKEALDGVVKGYNSVTAASERAIKTLEAEAGQVKKLLDAKRELDLANVEADKNNMTPVEYERKKLEIEARAEDAALGADAATSQKKIDAKRAEAKALREDAAKKLAEAGGIKVGTEEKDAETEAKYEKDANEALAFNKVEQAKIDNMLKLRDGEFGFRDIATKLETRTHVQSLTGRGAWGGQPSAADINEAIATTRQPMEAGSVTIARHDAFLRSKEARGEARKRRGDLVTEAGSQEGKAWVIDQQLGEDESEAGYANNANFQAGGMRQAAKVAGALGKANDKVKEMMDQMLKAAEGGNGISAEMLKRLKEMQAVQAELKREVDHFRGSPPRTQ